MGDPVRCLPKVVHPDVAALKLQHNQYACHEGNYGLLNILRGAREDELAAEVTEP